MSQGFTRPLTTADITVRKNTGSDVGSRPRLNFIEGSNVTLTISDDAAGGEIDITIAAAGGVATLNDVGNVTITSNSAGEILKWTGSAWVNNTLAEAGIADTSHAADHADGGSDELTGNLAANARVAVSKNSGATVGTRRTLNFIEGSNVTLTIADDSGGEEVDITIASTAGGGSPLTTKGDLFTYDTADARLPVGSNRQILKADSDETTGLRWADDPVFNVLDYGAVGNGSTDDTTAVQAAIDAAEAVGGTVFFPEAPGTYYLVNDLTINGSQGLKVVGVGMGSYVRSSTGSVFRLAPTSSVYDLVMQDLKIWNGASGKAAIEIVGSVTRSKFEDLYLHTFNASGHCIYAEGSTWGLYGTTWLRNTISSEGVAVSTSLIHLVATTGAGGICGRNKWEGGEMITSATSTAPIINMSHQAANMFYGNTFSDINVENANAGWALFEGCNSLTLQDITFSDNGSLTADLCKLGKNASGTYNCENVTIINMMLVGGTEGSYYTINVDDADYTVIISSGRHLANGSIRLNKNTLIVNKQAWGTITGESTYATVIDEDEFKIRSGPAVTATGIEVNGTTISSGDNTSSLNIYGGDGASGARIELFGSTHAQYANDLYLNADTHNIRTAAGSGIITFDTDGINMNTKDVTEANMFALSGEGLYDYLRIKHSGNDHVFGFECSDISGTPLYNFWKIYGMSHGTLAGDLEWSSPSDGALLFKWDESDDQLEISKTVDLQSNVLENPLDPTAGTHVGDRDYNDARYVQNETMYLTLSMEGAISTGTGSMRLPITTAMTAVRGRAMLGTASSSGTVTVDLNKNGTTMFGTKMTMAATSTDSGNVTPTVTAIAAGDYLTIDIDGAGTGAADLVVVLEVTKN